MRKFRKIVLCMLALLVMLAAMVPAYADETPTPSETPTVNLGTITVNYAKKDETYKLYKIFDLVSSDPETKKAVYAVENAWKGFFEAPEVGGNYVEVSRSGDLHDTKLYVKGWNGENSASRVQAFAQAALKYAETHTDLINAVAEKKADATTITFDGLSYGYYLLNSTLGTLCSLNTLDNTVTINEKNPSAGLVKEVKNTQGQWKKEGSYNIGDTVEFKLDIKVNYGDAAGGLPGESGYMKNFQIHDSMSKGLTFVNGSVVVKYTSLDSDKTWEDYEIVDPSNYEVIVSDLPNEETFQIKFKENFVKINDIFTVRYNAILNKDATIGPDGNPNEAHLLYGDGQKSPDSEVKVYTARITIEKYEKLSGEERKYLAGAKFVLRNSGRDKYFVAATFNEDGTLKEPAKWVDDINDATVVTTEIGEDGKATAEFVGLKKGTYYLVETEAPVGYNKIVDPIAVNIYGNDEEDPTKVDYSDKVVGVENTAGFLLPQTGGTGTTLFVIFGSILFIGAGILLVTKRRMKLIDTEE